MRKILYLEDSHIAQKIMSKSMVGFAELLCASNISGALKLLDTYEFVAFISDYNLEDGTGFDFIKKVRKMEVYKTTPIILVSAGLTQEISYQAMNIGVNCSRQKPISGIELKQLIAKQLKDPTIEEVSRMNICVCCIRWHHQGLYYEHSPELGETVSGQTQESAREKMNILLSKNRSKELGEIIELQITKHYLEISEP